MASKVQDIPERKIETDVIERQSISNMDGSGLCWLSTLSGKGVDQKVYREKGKGSYPSSSV